MAIKTICARVSKWYKSLAKKLISHSKLIRVMAHGVISLWQKVTIKIGSITHRSKSSQWHRGEGNCIAYLSRQKTCKHRCRLGLLVQQTPKHRPRLRTTNHRSMSLLLLRSMKSSTMNTKSCSNTRRASCSKGISETCLDRILEAWQ